MNHCVVEVGPATVRGPCAAEANMVTTALACIDDEIAILDDAPVTVAALWRQVVRAALPDVVDGAVLVCPTWWSSSRVECVREAAAATSPNVSVRQRASVLGGSVPGDPTIVEIAPDFVVTVRAGVVVASDPRIGEDADIAQSVAERIGPAATVVIDAPTGVTGGSDLGAEIFRCLKRDGVGVTTAHPTQVLRPSPEPRPRLPNAGAREPTRGKSTLIAALAVSVTTICLGLAFDGEHPEPPAIPMTLLVEGRVAVKVPALWVVKRITTGPGSARVQVVAPDPSTALLVTQAQVRKGETLAATSAALRTALDDQQAGVFTRFNPDDRRADRRVATYRELRDGRQIDWAVFVDDAVRIAVGCQSAPGGGDTVRAACEVAIQSAHAVF